MSPLPYTIALTGNIACGKSSVGRVLVELGADYLDTDAVVHDLLARDTPQARAIIEHFGPGVAAPAGGIIRSALGAIVFHDASRLRELERILHPRVEEIVHERIAATTAPVLVIDGVKIFETGLANELDELWVVICSEAEQQRRLASDRGMAPADIKARLRSQPPLEAKLQQARVVIDNSGTLEETRVQVLTAFQRVLAASTRR